MAQTKSINTGSNTYSMTSTMMYYLCKSRNFKQDVFMIQFAHPPPPPLFPVWPHSNFTLINDLCQSHGFDLSIPNFRQSSFAYLNLCVQRCTELWVVCSQFLKYEFSLYFVIQIPNHQVKVINKRGNKHNQTDLKPIRPPTFNLRYYPCVGIN